MLNHLSNVEPITVRPPSSVCVNTAISASEVQVQHNWIYTSDFPIHSPCSLPVGAGASNPKTCPGIAGPDIPP